MCLVLEKTFFFILLSCVPIILGAKFIKLCISMNVVICSHVTHSESTVHIWTHRLLPVHRIRCLFPNKVQKCYSASNSSKRGLKVFFRRPWRNRFWKLTSRPLTCHETGACCLKILVVLEIICRVETMILFSNLMELDPFWEANMSEASQEIPHIL